jgi:hypothetical protein
MQYVKDRLKPHMFHTYYTDSDVLGYVDCYKELSKKPTDIELDLWDKLDVCLNTPIPYDHPRDYYIFIKRVKNTPANLKKVEIIFDLAISADEIINSCEKYTPERWSDPEANNIVRALEDRHLGIFHKSRRSIEDQNLVIESFGLLKKQGLDIFEYISGKNSIEMAKNPPDQFYVKNLQVKDSFFGRKIETILIKGIPELYYLAKWYCPLSSSHKSNEALIKKVLRNQLST